MKNHVVTVNLPVNDFNAACTVLRREPRVHKDHRPLYMKIISKIARFLYPKLLWLEKNQKQAKSLLKILLVVALVFVTTMVLAAVGAAELGVDVQLRLETALVQALMLVVALVVGYPILKDIFDDFNAVMHGDWDRFPLTAENHDED